MLYLGQRYYLWPRDTKSGPKILSQRELSLGRTGPYGPP